MKHAHTRHLRLVAPPKPRLHPLITSLWVAAGLLFVSHIIWVACDMPVPAFLGN